MEIDISIVRTMKQYVLVHREALGKEYYTFSIGNTIQHLGINIRITDSLFLDTQTCIL